MGSAGIAPATDRLKGDYSAAELRALVYYASCYYLDLARAESNCRRTAYKAVVLTTELRAVRYPSPALNRDVLSDNRS